ncbi:MAG: thymidylate synthase [Promethearchaeota archaeon]
MASIIFIDVDDVSSAWREALDRVLNEGDDVKTQYDRKSDIPSKDSTSLINIRKPFSNPVLNRRTKKVLKVRSKFGNSFELYGELADVYLVGSVQSGYIEEVLYGAHDESLWSSSLSFPYSYHDRVFNYAAFSLEDAAIRDYTINLVERERVLEHEKLKRVKKVEKSNGHEVWKLDGGVEIDLDREISEQVGIGSIALSVLELPRINQIARVIEMLKESPETRRAQAITWRPYIDPFSDDPPCLQRLFFRVKDDRLLLQACWRSRDLFKAWEPNVNAMIRIQKMVADELDLGVGAYTDFCNSLHIYGRDIEDARDLLKSVKKNSDA